MLYFQNPKRYELQIGIILKLKHQRKTLGSFIAQESIYKRENSANWILSGKGGGRVAMNKVYGKYRFFGVYS